MNTFDSKYIFNYKLTSYGILKGECDTEKFYHALINPDNDHIIYNKIICTLTLKSRDNIENYTFDNCLFVGCKFINVNFDGTKFVDCVFSYCQFEHCFLHNVDIKTSVLYHVKFIECISNSVFISLSELYNVTTNSCSITLTVSTSLVTDSSFFYDTSNKLKFLICNIKNTFLPFEYVFDDGGYYLHYKWNGNELIFKSECREFDLKQVIEHWGNAEYPDRKRGLMYVETCKFINNLNNAGLLLGGKQIEK